MMFFSIYTSCLSLAVVVILVHLRTLVTKIVGVLQRFSYYFSQCFQAK